MYALAATLGQTVYSGDIPGAYLKAPIDDGTVVYIRQPQGFVKDGREDWWLKLNVALYGLPQAGQLWNGVFNKFLLSIGFTRNLADPCIYTLKKKDDLMVLE